MDIALHGYYYRLKRYWRRKKYERLTEDATTMAPKRKLKVVRLRSKSKKRPNFIKIRKAPKLRFMFILPLKMVAKFHEAYVNLAGGPTGNVIENNNSKVPKRRPMPMMLSGNSTEAMVDVRMVMELYNRTYAHAHSLSSIESD